eukprot:733253-Hanusia_phi.AAC.1
MSAGGREEDANAVDNPSLQLEEERNELSRVRSSLTETTRQSEGVQGEKDRLEEEVKKTKTMLEDGKKALEELER